MSRKTMELKLETSNRAGNFQQIVGLAEKLVESLARRVHQAEDTLK
jgi:hypothetical protein